MMKLFVFLIISLPFMSSTGMKLPYETVALKRVDQQIKKKALFVLEQKCNACHTKKKQVVFTEENMSFQFKAIEYQVFIKMRMPKGRVKLLNDERKVLKEWIDAEKLR